MEVTVIPFDKEEVINKIYTACRTCYTAGTPQEQYAKALDTDTEKKWKLINHVISSGHASTVEHIQFTFLISGVSRNLSHQLVRHRIASYSQQSQRYCGLDEGAFKYVTPSTIKRDKELEAIYHKCMEYISEAYKMFTDKGIPAEDARAVLPGACCTNLTVSMNLRALIHFTDERCCTCAQLEIRQLANKMAKLIYSEIPELKPYLGPKCESLGYCNESEQRTCGRRPLKEDTLKEVYKLS